MLPDWIGIPYCKLYATYKTAPFTLDDAVELTDKSPELMRKILSELKQRGLLIRDENYYLPEFDGFCRGVKLRDEFANFDREDRLRNAETNYLITGGYAAFLYHEYQFPADHAIRIHRVDYGFWFNLVDCTLEPSLTDTEYAERREIEGLTVEPPETVLVDRIAAGTVDAVLDAVALLIAIELDWERVIARAVGQNVVNEVGAVLAVVNQHIELVPESVLCELSTHMKKIGRRETYPKHTLTRDDTFAEVGWEWHLNLVLPAYTVSKPVEELVA